MCKQSFFSNIIYKLFRGNFPRQNFVVIYFGRNLGAVIQCCRCSGRNYSGKTVRGQKPRGKLRWREFHGGSLIQGGNFLWGKLFEGNYPEGNFLGWNFIGESCPGVSCPGGIFRANFPGKKFWRSIALGKFHGGNCQRGSCSGGNIWLP